MAIPTAIRSRAFRIALTDYQSAGGEDHARVRKWHWPAILSASLKCDPVSILAHSFGIPIADFDCEVAFRTPDPLGTEMVPGGTVTGWCSGFSPRLPSPGRFAYLGDLFLATQVPV